MSTGDTTDEMSVPDPEPVGGLGAEENVIEPPRDLAQRAAPSSTYCW